MTWQDKYRKSVRLSADWKEEYERKLVSAEEAAGKIHSDLARGFIRAECFSYDDIVQCGSEKVVREKGLFRLEGKKYIVQDGDILNIRFSV